MCVWSRLWSFAIANVNCILVNNQSAERRQSKFQWRPQLNLTCSLVVQKQRSEKCHLLTALRVSKQTLLLPVVSLDHGPQATFALIKAIQSSCSVNGKSSCSAGQLGHIRPASATKELGSERRPCASRSLFASSPFAEHNTMANCRPTTSAARLSSGEGSLRVVLCGKESLGRFCAARAWRLGRLRRVPATS